MKLSVVILAAGQGTRMCSAFEGAAHHRRPADVGPTAIRTAQSLAPDAMHVV